MAKTRSSSADSSILKSHQQVEDRNEDLKPQAPEKAKKRSRKSSRSKRTRSCKSFHSNSMPMTHLDFVSQSHIAPSPSVENVLDSPTRPRSSKGKAKRRNSVGISVPHHQAKKSVRFATNIKTDEVWSTVRLYEPEPRERRAELWTTKNESYDRYEDDMDLVDMFGDAYFETLLPAYDRCNESSKEVDIDFEEWRENEELRGLESEVMQEHLSFYVKRHQRAVLKTQVLVYQAEEEGYSDDDHHHDEDSMSEHQRYLIRSKTLRRISTKYSRRSQCIANKMAEFDEEYLRPPPDRWA